MVNFSLTSSTLNRSSFEINRPSPTTPRQKALHRPNLNGRSPTSRQDKGQTSRESSSRSDGTTPPESRSPDRLAAGEWKSPGRLTVGRRSPFEGRGQVGNGPEPRFDWHQSARYDSPYGQPSTSAARSPEEIQRLRRMLAEGSFDFGPRDLRSGLHHPDRSGNAEADGGVRELIKRDSLNSLEKRSTLKRFGESRSPFAAERKVSFDLGHDEMPSSGEPDMEAPRRKLADDDDDGRDTAPRAAPSPRRPQSAKNRTRLPSDSPETSKEGLSEAVAVSHGRRPASCDRPTTARTRDVPTGTRSTKTAAVLRSGETTKGMVVTAQRQSSAGKEGRTLENKIEDRTVAIVKQRQQPLIVASASHDTTKSAVPRGGTTATTNDQPLTGDAKATVLMRPFASDDQDKRRRFYSRSSLIHNVCLATKRASQKNFIVELAVEEKIKNMQYLGISCHDWSCNCRRPECVTRYDLREGRKHFDAVGQPTIRKDYILPEGCHLTSAGSLICAPPPPPPPPCLGAETRGGDGDAGTSRGGDEREFSRRMERLLRSRPISVRGPFRVSGPHWASRSHTQRWPWKGTTWVSVCGDEVTNTRNRRAVK